MDLMSNHLKLESFDRQLTDAFKVLDKEGSGFVAVSDHRHILTSIGEKLEHDEFDEWIKLMLDLMAGLCMRILLLVWFPNDFYDFVQALNSIFKE
ncbi:hypothetical protein RND81_12G161800 [Saponaria officinalis]|uniref:EF-hand domain-containing protein n=1 Tax=Saponaria officinalis TaxID=3572 RepID=A0AAW1HBC5_SAPOF